MSITAVDFLVTYGAYAEIASFVTTMELVRNSQILTTGIDPDTGEHAGFLTYAFITAEYLPPGKLIPKPLKTAAKQELRKAAREIFEFAGKNINRLEVHHIIPLEWAHVFPNRNPNAAKNIIALDDELHKKVGKMWTSFRTQFKNQTPTPEQVIEQVKKVSSYIGNRGVYLDNK
jgi:hypothetical protein